MSKLDDIFDKSTVALTREHDVLSGDADPALGQPGDIISITNYDKRVIDLPQAKNLIKAVMLDIIGSCPRHDEPVDLCNICELRLKVYEL